MLYENAFAMLKLIHFILRVPFEFLKAFIEPLCRF